MEDIKALLLLYKDEDPYSYSLVNKFSVNTTVQVSADALYNGLVSKYDKESLIESFNKSDYVELKINDLERVGLRDMPEEFKCSKDIVLYINKLLENLFNVTATS